MLIYLFIIIILSLLVVYIFAIRFCLDEQNWELEAASVVVGTPRTFLDEIFGETESSVN